MGDDGRPACAVRHLDGVERLGQGADLVELYEHRVCRAELDALLDACGVRDKQIVADYLDAVAEALCHKLPALPVVLAEAVLNGDDGVLVHKVLPHVYHLLARHRDAALGQVVALVLLAVPIADCAVDSDLEVLAGLVSGLFDSGDKRLERVLVAVKVRGVAALVADTGCGDDFLERMEHLGAHSERFLEALSAYRHYHELLNVDVRARGVRAAVEHVHHRHGQGLRVHAADVVIKAHAGGLGCRLRRREGRAEDGVRAETGLVRGTVYLDKHLVDRGLVKRVEADHRLGDLAVDVLDRKLNALAAVTAFVAVAQLAGFVHTGGCTGGDSRTADGAVVQRDFYLDSRVAAGVKDLAPHDVYYFKILLHIKNLLIGYMVIIPYRAGKIKMFVPRKYGT